MRGAVEFIIPDVPYYGLFSTVTELPSKVHTYPLVLSETLHSTTDILEPVPLL
jgi:hypothetical protein